MRNEAPKTIEVIDLYKSFGPMDVLKGVSLVAHRGDVVSLIGASGSGKSTVLRCINFLELPSRGRVLINNEEVLLEPKADGNLHPVDKRQLQRVRARVGMVFQSFNLWTHMTVLQNLIEAPIHVLKLSRAEAEERASVQLNLVGLYPRRHEYPEVLSGGEQQRVAIARALCMEPKALLFDEPTSALDPELSAEVLRVIRSLAEEGRTMIIVTHELAFAREISSHVAFLYQGTVDEEGTTEELFRSPRSERCRQFVSSILA